MENEKNNNQLQIELKEEVAQGTRISPGGSIPRSSRSAPVLPTVSILAKT